MNANAVRILLAEDDDGHALLVKKNLARVGFVNDITHVRDGQEAIDFIFCRGNYANRQLDGGMLVLLDINMPRLNGVEVLQRIKQDPTMSKLPVIMLTTTDDPREIKRCYEMGCSVYVTKPVAYESFVDAIQRLGLFLQVVTVMREEDMLKPTIGDDRILQSIGV